MLLREIVKIHGKKMKAIDTKINTLESTLDAFASLNLENVNDLISALRPAIGDIEINVTGTNPENKYSGTTWVAWGSGKVPVGVDSAQTEFNTVEKTGGEKSHKMTTAENGSHSHPGPSHTHGPGSGARFLNYTGTLSAETVGAIEGSGQKLAQILSGGSDVWYGGTATAAAGNGTTGTSGSGTAHNNLQPYITCYMWKRTA